LLSQNFGQTSMLGAGSGAPGLGAAATVVPAAAILGNTSSALPSAVNDVVTGIWPMTAGTDDSTLFSDAALQDVASVLD
jgi:hypothetical protein